jgi:hypothetical protein
MHRSLRFVVAVALIGAGFVGGALSSGHAAAGITRWTVADLKWSAVPDTPLMQAAAWSSAGGAYCVFNKFPKGTKIPIHHHTADVSAIVIAGQWGSTEPGATAKLLGPGAYQMIPGGVKHATECGPAADCVIFACGPAAFDLVPDATH